MRSLSRRWIRLLVLAQFALAAASFAVPPVSVLPGDALSQSDRESLANWVIAQPLIRDHIANHRVRLLRIGVDRPKGPGGGQGRATLHFRNYDRGIVHRVSVDLVSGSLEIIDVHSLVQPSADEREAAWAIMRRDPRLRHYFSDPDVKVSGGFYDRSHRADDPCSQDVCVLIEVIRRRPGHGFARQVVVNLSRDEIANSDFQTPLPRNQGGRMSAESR